MTDPIEYMSRTDPYLAITDPTLDESGRFAVDPDTYYLRRPEAPERTVEQRASFQDWYERACAAAEEDHRPLTEALYARGVRRDDCHVDQTGGMVFCYRVQLVGEAYVQASIFAGEDSCAGYMAAWDDEREPFFIGRLRDGTVNWQVLAAVIVDLCVANGYVLSPRPAQE